MREAGEIGCPSSSRAYSARSPPRMRLAWVVRSPEPDLDDGKRSVVSPPNARAPRRRYGVAAAVKRGGLKLASFIFWMLSSPSQRSTLILSEGQHPGSFGNLGPSQKRTVKPAASAAVTFKTLAGRLFC